MNSNVTEITNHVQQALARLLQQYKNQPRFAGLITALVQQVQDWENGVYPVNDGRQLYNGTTFPAVGKQLDGIGEIVGLQRNGLDDATYLVLILGTIAENNSETTAPELLNIVQTVFETSEVFIKTPNSPNANILFPAFVAFGVGNPGLSPTLFALAVQIVLNSIGAGINLMYISQFPLPKAFSMQGPQSWVSGFSSIAQPSYGGGFAGLIYNIPQDFLLTEGGDYLTTESGERIIL